jgi:hypothetical protein
MLKGQGLKIEFRKVICPIQWNWTMDYESVSEVSITSWDSKLYGDCRLTVRTLSCGLKNQGSTPCFHTKN